MGSIKLEPPLTDFKDPDVDGGRAWLSAIVGFFPFFIMGGTMYSFGVFVTPLLESFPSVGRGSIALISTISIGLFLFIGPFTGRLCDQFGSPRLLIFGGIMLGIGQCFAALASQYWHLLITLGFITGIGFGFILIPTLSTTNSRFVRYRGIANGLIVSGSGAGTLLFSLIYQVIIANYGWRFALLISGVWSSLSIVGVGLMFFIPGIGTKSRSMRMESINDNVSDHESISKLESMKKEDSIPPLTIDTSNPDMQIKKEVRKPQKIFDLKVFRSLSFNLMFMTSFLASFGYLVPYVFLVRSGEDIGMPASEAIVLLSVVGIANLVSRALMGFIGDRFLGRLRVLYISMAIIGISTILWGFCVEPWQLYVYSIVFGIFAGAYIAMLSPVTADVFGLESIGTNMGMLNMGASFGALLGPPLAGFAFDLLQSFLVPAIIGGILMAVTSPMLWYVGRLHPHTDFGGMSCVKPKVMVIVPIEKELE